MEEELDVFSTGFAFLVLTGNEGAIRFGLPRFEVFLCEYDLRVVKRTYPHDVAKGLGFNFFVIDHLIDYITNFRRPYIGWIMRN